MPNALHDDVVEPDEDVVVRVAQEEARRGLRVVERHRVALLGRLGLARRDLLARVGAHHHRRLPPARRRRLLHRHLVNRRRGLDLGAGEKVAHEDVPERGELLLDLVARHREAQLRREHLRREERRGRG
eukprot:5780624-Pleurochrysis_carterae.AAC.1